MKNIEYACYVLIASAFVLGAVVLVQLNDRIQLENRARAEMLIDKGLFTALSTQGRNTTEEFIYVLDARRSILVCYYNEPGSNRVAIYGTLDVAEAMDLAKRRIGGGAGGGGNSGR